MKNRKVRQKQVVLQQEQTDCGVACLLSVIRYYGGDGSFDQLRRLSGTTITGTTLLGLYQAAGQVGFDAKGCKSDMESMLALDGPCILHVVTESMGQHYIVCYGRKGKDDHIVIGDPARGMLELSLAELDTLWVSKKCLTLTPDCTFVAASVIRRRKRTWLISLLKEDLPLLIIICVIGLVIAILGLAMAVFSQHLLDEIIPGRQMEKLNLSVVSLLLILFLKEALSFLHQYFLLRQSREFNGRIIDFFYQRLMALPKSFFDTRKIGELTTRLNDTTRIQRVITQIVGISVVDTLIVLVTIGFIFSYSREAGLICMIILPFFYLLMRRYNGKIIYKQRSVMTTFAQVESNYISTLQGIEAIKNFRKQKTFIGLNNLIYRVYQDRLFGLGNFQVRLFFLANAFGISFIIAILVLASHRVMHGQLKPGELIAIIGACSMMLPRLATLAMLSIPVAEARIAFDRMFEFSAACTEKKEPPDVPLYLERIQIKDVAFRFPGGRQLLRQVSLIIRRGEIVGLIGENGSGKSTLAQLLQGHYPVEAGGIFVNEQLRLEDIPLQQWQGVIGLVPQQVHIFNGSVLENVVLDDVTASIERFLQFVQEFEFGPFLDLLPQSFNTLVGEEGINLSGGQKQMIALMRALYHRPQLLVLDEATTAMDRQSEKFVFRLLTRLREKMAVLIITHQLYSLRRVCDRMYIIESGRITGAGDHAGMLKTDNLYSRYWSDLVDR